MLDIPKRQACEAKTREYLKVHAHRTPGVNPAHNEGGCGECDVGAHLKPLSNRHDEP